MRRWRLFRYRGADSGGRVFRRSRGLRRGRARSWRRPGPPSLIRNLALLAALLVRFLRRLEGGKATSLTSL